MSDCVEKVHQVSYHRNGVGGEGFHAVLFDDPKHGRMVAIVFDGDGRCAVLNVDKLSDPQVGVAFGSNSWRGDKYESDLREAIKTVQSSGSARLGPFAIPTGTDGINIPPAKDKP